MSLRPGDYLFIPMRSVGRLILDRRVRPSRRLAVATERMLATLVRPISPERLLPVELNPTV